MAMDIKKKIEGLPDSCGVYIMKSPAGKVLYVGKATSLRKRVRSYFSTQASVKTGMLRGEVADIEFIACESPEQALIVEAALIKEEHPKYNISLRDSKTYPFVEVTREGFPRIFISRPKTKTRSLLFGPYPHAGLLKPALNMIRKVFPYCSCRRRPHKPCLYYHVRLCPAPCAGKISAAAYRETIVNICKILRGERRALVKKLQRSMQRFSAQQKFEEAAAIRDKLAALENLYQGKPREHALLSLKKILGLGKIPLRIEAVDVSILGAEDAVGSVVVFRDGVPDKRGYRRFRIKTVPGVDDCAMIAEVVGRRYTRLQKEKKSLPDLLVIDGGRGQVGSAYERLRELEIRLELIGIAKQREEIWFPERSVPVRIPFDNPALQLIRHVRDEAHRFAHGYQLTRRRLRLRQNIRSR